MIGAFKYHAVMNARSPEDSIITIHPPSTAATNTGAIVVSCTTARLD